MEYVKKQRQNFISLAELGYGLQEFNPRRVHLHFTKQVGENNCDKDCKKTDSLFKGRSHCRRVVES